MRKLRSTCIVLIVLVILLLKGRWCFGENRNHLAAQRMARQQDPISEGKQALERGKLALATGNLPPAYEDFQIALRLLPKRSGQPHKEAAAGFCSSGINLAGARIAEGRFGEAEAICREILKNKETRHFRPASELLARLQQPGYFNRTIGPNFFSKVEEVRKLLTRAEGYYSSGRYDLAFKRYEQILKLDPYNVAARRGEEKINLARKHYADEAYNETRSRQLWQVQNEWEEPVRVYGQMVSPVTGAFAREATGTARISHKLNSIIIPRIEFRDASVREAIEF